MLPLLYHEEQNIKKSWLLLLAAMPLLASLSIVVYRSLHWPNFSMAIHLVFVGASMLFFFWFLFLKLITRLNKEYLEVHFRGLPFAKCKISLNTIKQVKAVEYSPITDYGGWGLRYSVSGKGRCYTLSGNQGVLLEFHEGKNLLIGSKNAAEFEQKLGLLVNPKMGQ